MQKKRLDDEDRDIKGISVKERLFCAAYMENGQKAIKAYRAVFPDNKNPCACASSYLKKPRVQAYLSKLIEDSLSKLKITPQDIMTFLAKQVNFDPIDYFNEDGSMKNNLNDVDADARKAMSGIEFTTRKKKDGTFERHLKSVKFANRLQAVDLLAKVMKLYDPEKPAPNENENDRIVISLPANAKFKVAGEVVVDLENIGGEPVETSFSEVTPEQQADLITRPSVHSPLSAEQQAEQNSVPAVRVKPEKKNRIKLIPKKEE